MDPDIQPFLLLLLHDFLLPFNETPFSFSVYEPISLLCKGDKSEKSRESDDNRGTGPVIGSNKLSLMCGD